VPDSMPDSMFGHLFTTDELFDATSDEAWIEAMLEFERELAMSLGEAGLIPVSTATVIVEGSTSLRLDATDLGRAGRRSGNPAEPLVRALRKAVGPEAARAVHLGATSQDVVDTAAMLVSKRAGALILGQLERACDAAATLADEHRSTVLAGRTLLQQALPTTFGLKAAGWLVALGESGVQLHYVLDRRLAVQFGGAVGSLACLGSDGPRVLDILTRRLGLACPVLPWHADRVRMGELGSSLAVVAGAASKVATDLALLAQTEVREVVAGEGPSSTMPHKRNPVGSVIAGADARRSAGLASIVLSSMAHEHERAAGAWHAEWATLTELLRASGGCVSAVAGALCDLQVDPGRMRDNLDQSNGVLMAERVVANLAPDLGWEETSRLISTAVERALEGSTSFVDVLAEMAPIAELRTRRQLDELCDLHTYLGAKDQFIDRALAAHRRYRDG